MTVCDILSISEPGFNVFVFVMMDLESESEIGPSEPIDFCLRLRFYLNPFKSS
jgi:hypothetical protein